MTRLEPLKLGPSFREKIWGSTDLAPVFGKTAEPIGEAWYTHEQNTVVGGPLAGRTIVSLLEEGRVRMPADGGGAPDGRRFRRRKGTALPNLDEAVVSRARTFGAGTPG